MKVLITGINGFLGRNVAKRFLGAGYDVCGVSRHHDAIHDMLHSIDFLYCDLNNKKELEFVFSHMTPDVVIHCAWSGGNAYAQTNSSIQFDNVIGVVDLLNAMDKHSVPYFVGFGSAAEYGDKPSSISEKEYETPDNLYGACKKMAKEYSKIFCKTTGMRWMWVRPFYTYGPGDVSTRLIPKVVEACLIGSKLTLNSCKSMTDYLYISDFADGVLELVEHKEEGIFNVCSGNLYLVRDIVEMIGRETGHTQITFDPSLDRTGVPPKLLGNNGKLKGLGWMPKINIADGIRLTIEQHKRNV
jgi:nucleoside-diphosphate-sugar epimerase